jgi:hypothetical protein
MGKTGAIKAGRAFVEVFADNSKLVRGLRQAEKHVKEFGKSIQNIGLKIMALGTAAIAPLVASSKAFASMGDSVAKMAKRIGISVESLSGLTYAAELSGASSEELENSFRRMQRTIGDAADGMQTANESLLRLGLQMSDLAGMSPDQQFKLIGDRISQIKDPTLRAAAAMDVFGRAGTAMLPMLEDGAAGIDALIEEAKKLGLIMKTEDAKSAEEFSDALDRLWKSVKMVRFYIGAALAPSLKDFAARTTKVLGKIIDFIDRNRELVVSVLKVAVGVAVVGAALVVLGSVIRSFGIAIGGIASIFSILSKSVTVAIVIVKALVSPIGLTVIAIAALGAAILYYTGAGAKALSWLGAKFGELKNIAGKAFEGIKNAMAAGEYELAAKILWLSLQNIWLKGVDYLLNLWENFSSQLPNISTEIWASMRSLWQSIVTSLLVAWEYAIYGIKAAWAATGSFLVKAWIGMKYVWVSICNGFANAWAWTVSTAEILWSGFVATLEKAWNILQKIASPIDFDLTAANAEVDKKLEDKLAGIVNKEQKAYADNDQAAAESHANLLKEFEDEDAAYAAKKKAINQQAADMLRGIRQADADAQSKIEAERENAISANDKKRQESKDARAAKLAEIENELKKSLELAKFRNTEQKKRPTDPLEGKAKKIRRASKVSASTLREGTSGTGTFSGYSASLLGASGPASKIAEATQQTAKNTRRILDKIEKGGLAFS